MAEQKKYTSLSDINPDFAPLVPGVNEAFKQIWTYKDMNEFRGNWTKTRASYPENVPTSGFTYSNHTVKVSDGTEVDVRISRPEDAGVESLPLLFVLHGGGWVVGGHDSENGMSQSLCMKNRVAVISVDYRRAPEHCFPVALNDGYDVYQWVVQRASELKIDSNRIILGGTSAGANLIAALALRLRDEKALDGVVGQILNIPATCHPKFLPHDRFELNSYTQNAQSPTINGENMRWFWDQYYPQPEPDPLASPLLGSHEGLPPALIQVAGMDPLRDEGLAYEEALRTAGVPTTLVVYPGLPHGFVLATKMGFAGEYYQSMVDWTAGRLNAIAASGSRVHQHPDQQHISDITATD